MLNEKQKRANDFLQKTNTTIEIQFKKHDKHFADDKETRDIYTITIKRGKRQFTFDFGNSIINSSELLDYSNNLAINWNREKLETLREKLCNGIINFKNAKSWESAQILKFPKQPTKYDILSCLQKYDCGTFEDFCGDFDYDIDSRKAEKIYQAVKEEFSNVQKIWNDEEIEELRDIN